MFSDYKWVLYICLLGIVGSAALYAERGSEVPAGVLAGMFTLFIAVIADLSSDKIVTAIKEQRMHQEDIMIAEATGKAVYRAIKEEQDKKS